MMELHKFSDMLERYRWSKPDEQFRIFMEEYLLAKGCNVKVKIVLT